MPNGLYSVTVDVGDAGTAIDSSHWINIENQNAIAAFVPTDRRPSSPPPPARSRSTDGRITLSPVGGTNTKIDYVDIASRRPPGRPSLHRASSRPTAPSTSSPTSRRPPTTRCAETGAVDETTLGGGNVTRSPASPTAPWSRAPAPPAVAATPSASARTRPLLPSTLYRFERHRRRQGHRAAARSCRSRRSSPPGQLAPTAAATSRRRLRQDRHRRRQGQELHLAGDRTGRQALRRQHLRPDLPLRRSTPTAP